MSSTPLHEETPVRGLDRRRFIAAALALTAGAATLRQPLAGLPDGGEADAPALLATLGDSAAAGRIGAAYLAAHPEEASPDLLVQQLTGSLGIGSDALPATQSALLRALVNQVEQEYCTAPLVRADGWLLAPSEARLYALAALVNGPDTTQAATGTRPEVNAS